MKRELRIVALVFGGLALILVVLVGITYLILPHSAKTALGVLVDRGQANRVARAIAAYRLPAGYHLITAFESTNGERTAIFGPITDTRMTITLNQTIPGRPPAEPRDNSKGCSTYRVAPSEMVSIDGRLTRMRISECSIWYHTTREEWAIAPVRGRPTIIAASGPVDYWNADELHAFLASLH